MANYDREVCGLPVLTLAPILRVSSFKFKAGKSAKSLLVIKEHENMIASGGLTGLVNYYGGWNESTEVYSYAMLMQSQAAADKYNSTVREQFLSRIQPLLAEPPLYRQEFPMTFKCGPANKAAPGAGQVLRMASFRLRQDGSARKESLALMRDFQNRMRLGGMESRLLSEGLIACYTAWKADEALYTIVTVFASQAALDKFRGEAPPPCAAAPLFLEAPPTPIPSSDLPRPLAGPQVQPDCPTVSPWQRVGRRAPLPAWSRCRSTSPSSWTSTRSRFEAGAACAPCCDALGTGGGAATRVLEAFGFWRLSRCHGDGRVRPKGGSSCCCLVVCLWWGG